MTNFMIYTSQGISFG